MNTTHTIYESHQGDRPLNRLREKRLCCHPSIWDDVDTWYEYILELRRLKGRLFTTHTRTLAAYIHQNLLMSITPTKSIQNRLRKMLRSASEQELYSWCEGFSYAGLKVAGSEQLTDLELYSLLYGTSGKTWVKDLFKLFQQQSRRTIIHHALVNVTGMGSETLRKFVISHHYKYKAVTLNCYDDGLIGQEIKRLITLALQEVEEQHTTVIGKKKNRSTEPPVDKSRKEVYHRYVSDLGKGMINELRKAFTSKTDKTWQVVKDDINTKREIISEANLYPITNDELDALNFEPAEVDCIMKNLSICNYDAEIDAQNYGLYLKGAVQSKSLILFIKSRGKYYVRSPNGGCWFWSLLIHDFLYNKAPNLPCHSHNTPRTALAPFVRHILNDYGVEVVYTTGARNGHMVVPINLSAWKQRVCAEFTEPPLQYRKVETGNKSNPTDTSYDSSSDSEELSSKHSEDQHDEESLIEPEPVQQYFMICSDECINLAFQAEFTRLMSPEPNSPIDLSPNPTGLNYADLLDLEISRVDIRPVAPHFEDNREPVIIASIVNGPIYIEWRDRIAQPQPAPSIETVFPTVLASIRNGPVFLTDRPQPPPLAYTQPQVAVLPPVTPVTIIPPQVFIPREHIQLRQEDTFQLPMPVVDQFLSHVDRNRMLNMGLIPTAMESKNITQQEVNRSNRLSQGYVAWLMQCVVKTQLPKTGIYVNTPKWFAKELLAAQPSAKLVHIKNTQRTHYTYEAELSIQELVSLDKPIVIPYSLYTLSPSQLSYLIEHFITHQLTIFHMNIEPKNGALHFFSGQSSTIINGIQRIQIDHDEPAPITGWNHLIQPLDNVTTYTDYPGAKCGVFQSFNEDLSYITPKAWGLYIELDCENIYRKNASVLKNLTLASKLTYLQTNYGTMPFPALSFYIDPLNKFDYNTFQDINTEMVQYFDNSQWLSLDQWVSQKIYDGTLTLAERVLCLFYPSSYSARIKKQDWLSKLRRFFRPTGPHVVQAYGPHQVWPLGPLFKLEENHAMLGVGGRGKTPTLQNAPVKQTEQGEGNNNDSNDIKRTGKIESIPYLRRKDVTEIPYSTLERGRPDVTIKYYKDGKQVNVKSIGDGPSYHNNANFYPSGYKIINTENEVLTQFEYDSRSENNFLNCIGTRMLKFPSLPSKSVTLRKFKRFIGPKIDKLLHKCRIVPTDIEQWLATKDGWSDNKKQLYRTAISRQARQPNTETKKYFSTFLKTGEQYTTTQTKEFVYGLKSRSRLIFSPIRNTFGIPCIINNLIMQALAKITPGFCYRLKYSDIETLFSKVRSPIIDMDASSNEYQQHGAIKGWLQEKVFSTLWPQIRSAIPSISPTIIDSYYKMLINPASNATFSLNKKLVAKLQLKGMLQSGDPCTTWFNTLSIIMYLNYYLRRMNFTRIDGLIIPTNHSGLWVSGDDQVVWHGNGLLLWDTINKYVSPTRKRPKLQRYCDPISYHQPGEFFSFISLVIQPGPHFCIIRDPQKMIMNSQVYSGRDKELCSTPSEHSALVALSMSLSNSPQSLLYLINASRARMGGLYDRSKHPIFEYRYGGRDAIGNQDALLYEFMEQTYGIKAQDTVALYSQFHSINNIGQTIVLPTRLVLDAKCARKCNLTASGCSEMVLKRKQNKKQKARKNKQTNVVAYNQSLNQKFDRKIKQVKIDTAKLVHAQQRHGDAWGLNGPVLAWEASLRFPTEVRNVRIPAPFIARSATCHVQQTGVVQGNASGNFLLTFDPNGQIGLAGSPLVHLVNGATFTDGTLPLPAVSKMSNPFASGSSKPVALFAYRVVSASLEVTPIMALTSQTGTMTYGFAPGFAIADFTIFDNVKDFPSITQTSAVNSAHCLYEPQDPTDLTFSLESELITDKNSRNLFCLVEGGLAAGSYRWTIHVNYEFQPTQGLDFFNTTATPLGDPSKRLELSKQSDNFIKRAIGWISGPTGTDPNNNQLLALKKNEVSLVQQTVDKAKSLAGTVSPFIGPLMSLVGVIGKDPSTSSPKQTKQGWTQDSGLNFVNNLIDIDTSAKTPDIYGVDGRASEPQIAG